MLIFPQIQSLGLSGDALAGIIPEFPALSVHGRNTVFGAQDLLLIQFGTVQAVTAAGSDLLSEQHGSPR